MEVNLINDTEQEIFVKINGEKNKTSILQQKNHTINLKEIEKLFLEIIYKTEDQDENYYELLEACSIDILPDGIFQIRENQKTMLNKMTKEEYSKAIKNLNLNSKKKLQTIYKIKNFNFFHDQLKKDEFIFLNNDKLNLYIFKELKFTEDRKVEALLIKKESLKEVNVDCLQNKISNLIKIKLIVIHSENIIFERHLVININQKIEEIYKIIQEKLQNLIIGKSFRLVFKNVDISPKSMDKKVFRNVNIENESENVGKKQEDNSSENSEEGSCINDESNDVSDPQDSEENEESHSCRTDAEVKKTESNADIEESEEKIIQEGTIEEDEQSESTNKSKKLSKKDNSLLKKQESTPNLKGKMADKSLVDLDFNFEKNYLCIIPPENNFKIFNLTAVKNDSFCFDSYSKSEFQNILIFSKDLIIKNLCISWYNYGNSCSSTPEYDLMIYEMDIDPIEKANNLETYYNKEENIKYKNLESVWSDKKPGNYKLLFEKRKIKAENCGEDSEFKKTISNGFYIPTNEMKIYANKIYCFIFKFGQNDNYYEYSSLYYNEQRFKIEGEEDLDIYGHANNNYYFIFGFNYKFNIPNSNLN